MYRFGASASGLKKAIIGWKKAKPPRKWIQSDVICNLVEFEIEY